MNYIIPPFSCFMIFLFFQVYLTILILPWTRLRERLALPSKCIFSLPVLCLFLGVLSSISPTLASVHLARFSMLLSTLLQKPLLGTCSLCHGIEIAAMIASVSSISGMPILGFSPSWCMLRFTFCFVVSHTLHTTVAGALLPNGSWCEHTM